MPEEGFCEPEALSELFSAYRKTHPQRGPKVASLSVQEDIPACSVDGLRILPGPFQDDDVSSPCIQWIGSDDTAIECRDGVLLVTQEDFDGLQPLYEKLEKKKCIWVITGACFLMALEHPHLDVGNPKTACTTLQGDRLAPNAQRSHLAHTNLTGAKSAYCGGELYFLKERGPDGRPRLIINGVSGRYPPYRFGHHKYTTCPARASLAGLYPQAGEKDELLVVAGLLKTYGYHVGVVGYDSELGRWKKWGRIKDVQWM